LGFPKVSVSASLGRVSGVMQASWGAENHARQPERTGELYGEAGRWYVPNTCSIADVFTRCDPGVRGADDAKTKFHVKQYELLGETQGYTNKLPSQQDIQPVGLTAGAYAHPDRMGMNDHDMGIAWPPPKGQEHLHAKFMGMVNEPTMHRDSVGGIMVGYKGHVPRSRDKVGANPLGGIIAGRSDMGFPTPEESSPNNLPAFGAQTSCAATGEHPLYVTVAQAHVTSTVMANSGVPPPNKPTATVSGDGFIPRYAGHKPKTYDSVGGSIYGASSEGVKQIAPSTFQWETIHGNFDLQSQQRTMGHLLHKDRRASQHQVGEGSRSALQKAGRI